MIIVLNPVPFQYSQSHRNIYYIYYVYNLQQTKKMILRTYYRFLPAILILFFLTAPLQARISRIVITKTEPYLEGKTFGSAGSFVRISGQAYGEVDPANPLNALIQDIQLAPKNRKGLVEYVSDFVVVRPADISKANGILFLSLPNRGNAFPADSALLARGYIYYWCAWQGDVLSGNNRLIMRVPYAGIDGGPVAGELRTEFQVTELTVTLPLSGGFFTGLNHKSYESVSLENTNSTLTKRILESGERIPVPNDEWAFADCSKLRYPGFPSKTRISMRDGFEPGYIYELIYTAKDPIVMGLGFAAIRDFSSFLKNNIRDDAGLANPVLGEDAQVLPVKAAIMQGVSQCSNFARTFLLLGFNRDENGKQVFDGVNAHIGPRKISLNVRFGRPGGGGLQREDHLFPGNEPPYSWDNQTDPISGITGGLLQKCYEQGTVPKIIQTLSSTEYWQSRASLMTTDSYGKTDVAIPPDVRIYLFAGTQHSPSDRPDLMTDFPSNDNQYAPYLRALVVALEKWILGGKEPPASAYPTIAAGTLVSPEKESVKWPDIPGVEYKGNPNELPLLDFGSSYDFRNVTGVIERALPNAKSEDKYKTLVPKVDRDGNEIGGIRGIGIRVPVGTYTGWALRKHGYGEGDLAGLTGMFIPFRKNREDRMMAGDPRLSLEERYKTRERYLEAVRGAAAELVNEGFLLPEDARVEIMKAEGNSVLK